MKYCLIPLGLTLLLSSCGKKEGKTTDTSTQVEQKNSLQGLLLESAPEGAVAISELRSSAKVGDSVAFKGKLIGGDPVLIENRAIMTLGDPAKLTSCDLMEEDHCQTPWDVCCDDSEEIKQNIVTVQAVDEAGVPVKEGFRGLSGLKELSSVVILGSVAEGSNEENMVVNATGVYVGK